MPGPTLQDLKARLTPTQFKVVHEFMRTGLTCKQVAKSLKMHPRTVEHHKHQAAKLIGFKSMFELGVIANTMGIFQASPLAVSDEQNFKRRLVADTDILFLVGKSQFVRQTLSCGHTLEHYLSGRRRSWARCGQCKADSEVAK